MTSALFLLFSLFMIVSVVVISDGNSARAFSGGPDPAKTGGFGELTCHQSGCHNSFELNAGRAMGLGDLLIEGFPKEYEPGKTYPIKLALTHTQDRKYWGFQLATRVKETGTQAGSLKPADNGTQVLEEKGIQYIEHTLEGIATNTFQFNWVAPASAVGEILMNAAGNAADGGGSPEEDYIYTTSASISPPTR